MKTAPERVGGARLVHWSPIDERHRPTGGCRHPVAGVLQGSAERLAICQHEGETAFYLDTWHETLEEAQDQAEFEYEGVAQTWNVG